MRESGANRLRRAGLSADAGGRGAPAERWHSYWRYEQVPEGVIAECESVSLSRPVPWGFGFMVDRLIDSTARQSMERALTAVRAQLGASANDRKGTHD
jgi:hypothetical protein